jgi:hypothetical protein
VTTRVPEHVPPPATGDVLRAAEALEWPCIELEDGRVLDDEASWRAAVGEADDAALLTIWRALGAL